MVFAVDGASHFPTGPALLRVCLDVLASLWGRHSAQNDEADEDENRQDDDNPHGYGNIDALTHPINPDKPKKAMAISAAVTMAMGMPLKALGTLLDSSLSRMQA